jgi:large subunit ribosomal protein L17
MRHRNSVRQLGRTQAHRKAMFANMVTSLILHERIVTTKQKGKELKRISEKIITRAKRNLNLLETEAEKKLHNKREVMKRIKNRNAIVKLFDEIAGRFKERNGGYTRLYLIGKRAGDCAEMAIVELVDRKKVEPAEKKVEKKAEKKDKKEKK